MTFYYILDLHILYNRPFCEIMDDIYLSEHLQNHIFAFLHQDTPKLYLTTEPSIYCC